MDPRKNGQLITKPVFMAYASHSSYAGYAVAVVYLNELGDSSSTKAFYFRKLQAFEDFRSTLASGRHLLDIKSFDDADNRDEAERLVMDAALDEMGYIPGRGLETVVNNPGSQS